MTSAFPPDADLDPIVPPAAPAASEPVRRTRPVIVPAEPRTWSVELTLVYPLLVDGERLERITVRRLTGRDIADVILDDDDETTLNMRVRAAMAGLHPDVIDALSADDAEAFAAACRPFLPRAIAAIEAQLSEDAGEIGT